MIDLTGIWPGDRVWNEFGQEAVCIATGFYSASCEVPVNYLSVYFRNRQKLWVAHATRAFPRIDRWEPRADVVELRAENARSAAEVARYREVMNAQGGSINLGKNFGLIRMLNGWFIACYGLPIAKNGWVGDRNGYPSASDAFDAAVLLGRYTGLQATPPARKHEYK